MAQILVTPAHRAASDRARRLSTFIQGVWFVLGFATFIIGVLGLIGTVLGDLFFDARKILQIAGGVMLIGFGLFTLGVIKIPFLYSDTRRSLGGVSRGVGAAQSYLTGLSFAAGWSPCIGPFLGAILSLSFTASGIAQRLILLTAYVAGLGVPFLLVALLADRLTPLLAGLKRNMRAIELISGGLLIGIGILMLMGQLAQFSQVFSSVDLGLDTAILGNGGTEAPSFFIAAAAGFLSFASPCVLPLVPAYLGYIGGWAVNSADRV